MIPAADPGTGHLPVGRYPATLTEVRARFVDDPVFAGSTTRRNVWDGLVAYLLEWQDTELALYGDPASTPLLIGLWLAGSFVSAKTDPSNVDVTVITNAASVLGAHGRPGAGRIRKLLHRDGVLVAYRVSPLELPYTPVVNVFRPELLTPPERDYLEHRGGWDDWWQRTRSENLPQGPPTPETVGARRGYLEVNVR